MYLFISFKVFIEFDFSIAHTLCIYFLSGFRSVFIFIVMFL